MKPQAARAVFARAPHVHLAGVTLAGDPVLRALHGVVLGEHLYMHASPAGEKVLLCDRAVLVQASETIVDVPSTFSDPVKACPATTFYRSAQARGVLERVDDLEEKAAALQALMERFQPSGGYRPITADDRMYRASVRGLLVLRVSLERVEGKAKLGQNVRPERLDPLLRAMWRRGTPGDLRAIVLASEAHPSAGWPAWLEGPDHTRLLPCLDDAQHAEAAQLASAGYWNDAFPVEALTRAFQHSAATVGAVDADGALVGCARAVSDSCKRAAVYDVMVRPDRRGRGIGEAMMRLLLDHAAVRAARTVSLGTRDAHPLYIYKKLGFVETGEVSRPFGAITTMELRR